MASIGQNYSPIDSLQRATMTIVLVDDIPNSDKKKHKKHKKDNYLSCRGCRFFQWADVGFTKKNEQLQKSLKEYGRY